MIRHAFIAFALCAGAAAAQTQPSETRIEILECSQTAEGVACSVETERPVTFCMAVDAAGEPLANSTGATDDGTVLFQEIDAAQIASLRCRDV